MRSSFIKAVEEIYSRDPKTMLITGDLGFMAFEELQESMGKNFINAGLAEANTIGLAHGLAQLGYKPFVYSMIPFLTLRCLEHIRTILCQPNVSAILVGVGSGYSYGNQGPSHHAIEDIAAMAALPNMTVISPVDPYDAYHATLQAYKNVGPTYLRLAKNNDPALPTTIPRQFDLGKAIELRKGSEAAIIATGQAVVQSLKVATALAEEGLDIGVYSFHTIKPFDTDACNTIIASYPLIFTAEHHVEHGGFGSIVASHIAKNVFHRPLMHSFHYTDAYISTCFSSDDLHEIDGLSPETMKETIRTTIRNRS